MKKMTIILLFCLIVSFHGKSQSNQILQNTAAYQVTKISKGIILDGIPDEEVWQTIDPLPMVMLYPIYGSSPTEDSEIKIAFDDEFFYLVAKLYYKNKDEIRAIGKKRDYLSFSPDWLGFTIDTYNDNQNAYTFGINPNNARNDGTIQNDLIVDSDINFSWNGFWDSKTMMLENGWSAEMRIPFSNLRFQVKDGHTTMGLIVFRGIAAKGELVSWPEISPQFIYPYWKPSLGNVIEFNQLNPEMKIYVTPYATAGIEQENTLNDVGTGYNLHSKFKKDAGLDVKYSISTNMTADLTVNTDFAQVEADNQRINLTRFSLYFPEKRLFFLEKADVFDFSLLGYNNLFYSRRIGLYKGNPVRIYGGMRLTGRLGEWDIGILDMQTAAYREQPSENFGAIRTKRSIFNPNSYIGGMVTSRIGTEGSYNLAYGLDAIVRVVQDDYLTLKWAQSFEDKTQTEFISRHPGRFIFEWERRRLSGFSYDFIYSWSGKEFNPGIGFEVKDNFHGPQGILKYGWLYKEKKIRYHAFSLAAHKWWDAATGNDETTSANAKWTFETAKGANYYLMADWSRENLVKELNLGQVSVPVGEYTFTNYSASYSTSNRKNLTSTFFSNAGIFYDGWRWTGSMFPNLKIGANFDIGLYYRYDWVRFPERKMEFTNHIVRFNVLMTLTTKTSFSAFIQYNTAIDGIIGNFRFRYNPRDGTDFYIVYDERLNTNRHKEVPYLPFSSGRTILLKYSYTFRW